MAQKIILSIKGNKEKPEKERAVGTMDKILVFLGVITVLFVIAMTVIFCIKGAVPDVLITCFFGLVGGECGVMGMIQNRKNRIRERRYELEDRKYEEEKEKRL